MQQCSCKNHWNSPQFDPMLVVTGCPTLMVARGHAGLPLAEFGKSFTRS